MEFLKVVFPSIYVLLDKYNVVVMNSNSTLKSIYLMFKLNRLLILSALFLVLTVLFSCSSTDDRNLLVFRYNESKGISSLDPAFARSQSLIWPVHQLFDGLVQFDEQLNIVPAIAKSWTISDDGLLYTFYLRTDVLFHPHVLFKSKAERIVTAHDFVYSFNRVVHPSTASPGAWIFSKLDIDFGQGGVYAVNDSVLQLRLSAAFPPFLGMLGMKYSAVVPRRVVEHAPNEFGANPIGTGPFLMKIWRQGEILILHANPEYYQLDSSGSSLPYIDAVSVTFINDKQSEFMEFMLGKVDFISGINSQFKDALLTRSGNLREENAQQIYLQKAPYLNTEYLGFNLDSTQGDVVPLAVRKAINYCFNREEMVMYMRNNMADAALKGMVPPSLSKPYGQELVGYQYDKNRARKILSDAGFKNGYPNSIDLYTTSDYVDLCEYIQHNAKQIGININIHLATGASFRNLVANGKAQMFRGSWIADYPDAENYLSLFYSGNKSPNGPNYTRFYHAKFDSLYIQSLTARDSEKYLLYLQMEQLIISNAPVVPLFYDNVVRFVNRRVADFPVNPLNLLEIKCLRLD